MYYKVGENDLTLEDLARAIELRPDDVELYSERAFILDDLGYLERAVGDLSRGHRTRA